MRKDEAAFSRELANQLMDWIEEHRASCPSATCPEPANMMAYLCHVVGLRVEDLGQVRALLGEYEARCENCQHRRN